METGANDSGHSAAVSGHDARVPVLSGTAEMDLIIWEVLGCTSCGVRQMIGLQKSRRPGTGWAERCVGETGQAVLWIFRGRF